MTCFLVIQGSGVFRCSEVVLPAQQQNLIILKPGQGGRLNMPSLRPAGSHPGAVSPPQMLAQLQDETPTALKKVQRGALPASGIPWPDSRIYMLLKSLARKLLCSLRRQPVRRGSASSTASCRSSVLALRCLHPCPEFHTASGQPPPPDA